MDIADIPNFQNNKRKFEQEGERILSQSLRIQSGADADDMAQTPKRRKTDSNIPPVIDEIEEIERCRKNENLFKNATIFHGMRRRQEQTPLTSPRIRDLLWTSLRTVTRFCRR